MSLQLVQENQENLIIDIAELLSLKDVVKGAGAFAMREIDPNNLESLICSDPASWPPISVTKSTGGYVYFDGQHRIQAAKARKLASVRAVCRSFAHVNELIEAAFRANLKHGLQASHGTRSDYCYWLHITYSELSQRQIAARVGVTQSTVSRAIEQRKKQLEEAIQEAKQQEQEEGNEDGDEIGQWKEGVIKRAKNFIKSVGKFSLTLKETGDYPELVRELQFELLREPEDRQALAFTGQLLLDAANRSKSKSKGKVL